MRVVLDTNVVVSALLWGGTPLSLLDGASEGRLQLFTSATLIEELRGVLARKHLSARLKMRQVQIEQAIALYADLAIVIQPPLLPSRVSRDQDDDHVLAAAVRAEAKLIVSGDLDLLVLGRHAGIQIVNPAGALNVLSEK